MFEKPNLLLTLTYLLLTDTAVEPQSLADLNSDLAILDQYQVQEESDDALQEFFNIFGFNRTAPTTSAPSSTTTVPSKVNGKGSRSSTSFNRGIKGNSSIQNDRGFYGIIGSEDIGTVDDSKFYGQSDGIATAVQASSGDIQRILRKGSKTRGFHRIHHKDEFKKDRVFFEDDMTNGNVKKSVGNGVALRTGTGAKVLKENSKNGTTKAVLGKSGYFDISSLQKQLQGFANALGFDASVATK